MVDLTFNPSTWEVDSRGVKWILGQPRLQWDCLSLPLQALPLSLFLYDAFKIYVPSPNIIQSLCLWNSKCVEVAPKLTWDFAECLNIMSDICYHSSECYLEFAALGWNTSESPYSVFSKDHSRVTVLMSSITADCIIKIIQKKMLVGNFVYGDLQLCWPCIYCLSV